MRKSSSLAIPLFGSVTSPRGFLKTVTARIFGMSVVALLGCLLGTPVYGEDRPQESSAAADTGASTSLLTPGEWKRLDNSVDRGLEFLSRSQRRDGSFETLATGQPGVTSLCVMAFLSRGHLPDEGPYGKRLGRAVDFVLATQQQSGAFSYVAPNTSNEAGHAALYNHAMTGLMLSEIYGMTDSDRQNQIRKALMNAIAFARKTQRIPKPDPRDKGGWRYVNPKNRNFSDMSVTSWFLMFYRSARNAEFDVPKQYVDDAMAYVRRCFFVRKRAFVYRINSADGPRSLRRGIVGSGIVSLSLAGEHKTKMAQLAGDWILDADFKQYNRTLHKKDRYHYSAFYCSQAMFHLGGEYWTKFYPGLMHTLVTNQRADGSWDAEALHDTMYGNVYTSALTVLALTPPYQLLPIYQK
jgi:hypothetical protein